MYEEFGEIINTMKFNNYDYTKNITLNALNDRKNGKNYSLSDHICSMVFALLSNQRPWKHIADNQENTILRLLKELQKIMAVLIIITTTRT